MHLPMLIRVVSLTHKPTEECNTKNKIEHNKILCIFSGIYCTCFSFSLISVAVDQILINGLPWFWLLIWTSLWCGVGDKTYVIKQDAARRQTLGMYSYRMCLQVKKSMHSQRDVWSEAGLIDNILHNIFLIDQQMSTRVSFYLQRLVKSASS